MWGGHPAEALSGGTQLLLSLQILLVSDWGLSLDRPLSTAPTSAFQPGSLC